jgi:hypothetical protein
MTEGDKVFVFKGSSFFRSRRFWFSLAVFPIALVIILIEREPGKQGGEDALFFFLLAMTAAIVSLTAMTFMSNEFTVSKKGIIVRNRRGKTGFPFTHLSEIRIQRENTGHLMGSATRFGARATFKFANGSSYRFKLDISGEWKRFDSFLSKTLDSLGISYERDEENMPLLGTETAVCYRFIGSK